MGIEPTLAAWEAAVLPLNYTRAAFDLRGGPARSATQAPHAGQIVRSGQCVQVLNEGCHRPAESLHLRVARLNAVVLAGRVRAGAMTHAKVTGRQAERRAREEITGPRAGRARP